MAIARRDPLLVKTHFLLGSRTAHSKFLAGTVR
jgi:hypothetical protein